MVVTNTATLKRDFIKAFEGAPADYLAAMLFAPSGSASEKYGWLGQAPNMREWKDERVPAGLRDWEYTIRNKRFENSLSVDVPELERDQIGAIRVRIGDLAVRAKDFPHGLLSTLRKSGATLLCYDGAAFFATTHSEGDSGTQSNKLSQTGATIDNVKTDFVAARTAMTAFKDDRGQKPVRVALDLVVVCSPAMEFIMREVFENPTLAAGGKNIYAGQARVEVDTGLSGNAWILENRAGMLRGFILQEELPVRLSNTDVTSDEAFMRGKVFFGTEWRGNAGYGDWRYAVSVGTIA